MANDERMTTTTAAPKSAPAAEPMVLMSSQEIKGQRIAESKAQADANPVSETVEGGRYAVMGLSGKVDHYVNANGERLD